MTIKQIIQTIAAPLVIISAVIVVDCNREKGTDKFDLGTITFKTDQTWKIGNQEWSDVVMATGCEKDDFKGMDNSTLNFCADCRQNPDYGILFSWQAVNQYDSVLCPDAWRVPTKEDFVNLNIALGGTKNVVRDSVLSEKYLTDWGGTYSGYCVTDGSMRNQGIGAGYWSQSEYNSNSSHCLYWSSATLIYPQDYYYKGSGFVLRCVK